MDEDRTSQAGRQMPKPKYGDLHDYASGRFIRPATEREQAESREAARWDGGAGVIVVRWGHVARSVYVDD
jgi:hypothetical protein